MMVEKQYGFVQIRDSTLLLYRRFDILSAEIGNVTVVYAGRTVSAFGGIPVVDFPLAFAAGI